MPDLLEGIMALLPVVLMQPPADLPEPEIWTTYKAIIEKNDNNPDYEYPPRYDFYERARKAYPIVATSQLTRYANIILRKGVIVG